MILITMIYKTRRREGNLNMVEIRIATDSPKCHLKERTQKNIKQLSIKGAKK